jgi:hypothetical protein
MIAGQSLTDRAGISGLTKKAPEQRPPPEERTALKDLIIAPRTSRRAAVLGSMVDGIAGF